MNDKAFRIRGSIEDMGLRPQLPKQAPPVVKAPEPVKAEPEILPPALILDGGIADAIQELRDVMQSAAMRPQQQRPKGMTMDFERGPTGQIVRANVSFNW